MYRIHSIKGRLAGMHTNTGIVFSGLEHEPDADGGDGRAVELARVAPVRQNVSVSALRSEVRSEFAHVVQVLRL